jgi:hypothetical protein
MTTDRRNKYNLAQYTDGGTYTHNEGEHFHVSQKTYRTRILNYAKTHNLYVKTIIDWYPNRVTFRFFKNLKELNASPNLTHPDARPGGLPPCVVCGAKLNGNASDKDQRCIERVNGVLMEKHPEFR